MEEMSADIPAPVRASVTASGYDNVSGRACQFAVRRLTNAALPLSITLQKFHFNHILTPADLVRLGSKALLKLNSSAKTRARVANQKQWDINQQLKHYFAGSIKHLIIRFQNVHYFPK